MSLSSGFSVTEELGQTLDSMKDANSPVQVLKVQIQNDKLAQVKVVEGSPTKDLTSLSAIAEPDAAAYFLMRITQTKWACVTYVPEGLTKVKDRMLYASTQGKLKTSFGPEYIAEDVQIASFEELSGKGKPFSVGAPQVNREELLSQTEKNIQEAIRQESIARKEQEDKGIKKGEIGGYHAVSMPLSSDIVNDALPKFKSGEFNWIELAISDNQKQVDLKESKSISSQELNTHVRKTEPRFYIYKVGIKNVLIYCCPTKSATKLRMVYSTTKPSVIQELSRAGLELDKKLEFTEVDELSHTQITEEMNSVPRYSPSNNNNNNNKPPSVIPMGNAQHPVYGLMAKKSNSAGELKAGRSEFEAGAINVAGKKKIIIPPPVAYQ
jgi:hypothetical protein